MGLIDRFLTKRGFVKAEPGAPGFLRIAAEHDQYQVPDPALADNQLKLYQALSWVMTAADMVAKAGAVVPLSVLQLSGEDKENIENHPLELLMGRPNPLQSRYEFLFGSLINYAVAGNTYWWKNSLTEKAAPTELYLLPSNRTRVVPGNQIGCISHYELNIGAGQLFKLRPWEVVHIKRYHPRNMWVGLSSVEAIAMGAETDLKAQQYNLNFYGKDFAKPEGILAFEGRTIQPNQELFEQQLNRNHGGLKRSLATWYGSKAEYIQMALSQSDMQYLANRTHTKEEIFNVIAPGAVSMLTANATEANARTGKATMFEFAVWPALVSLAEKVTNDLLPLYGDNLVAEFDDVRLGDTAMELREIEVASGYMTIEEIRQKYYNLEPLGDERDEMLTKQVAAGAGLPSDEDEQPDSAVPPALLQTSTEERDEMDVPAKAMVIDVTPEPTEADAVEDELRIWQRFVENRMKAGRGLREFESDIIPPALKGAIEGALEAVTTAEGARLVFADALAWRGYP